jgi:hypothetical protein
MLVESGEFSQKYIALFNKAIAFVFGVILLFRVLGMLISSMQAK